MINIRVKAPSSLKIMNIELVTLLACITGVVFFAPHVKGSEKDQTRATWGRLLTVGASVFAGGPKDNVKSKHFHEERSVLSMSRTKFPTKETKQNKRNLQQKNAFQISKFS